MKHILNYEIIVVGGGASGLMAAYSASMNGKKVLLLEQNEKLGKKIYITGKGRCNFTNIADRQQFFKSITSNSKFIFSSFFALDNQNLIRFFEEFGVKSKVERGGRVFPKSDKSSDIIKALTKACEKVEIHLNEKVMRIEKDENFCIKTNLFHYQTEKLIIATGGLSYPSTGSTGDGYLFLEKFNHNIIPPKPSLCPIILDDKYIKEVAGITVKNAEISIFEEKKPQQKIFGDFLFTHRGLSGPIILTASDYLTEKSPKAIEIFCDFKPAIPQKELEERLLKDIDQNPKQELKNLIKNYFPQKLGEYLIKNSGLDLELKSHQITKETRKQILNMMKNFKFNYRGLDEIKYAIITKGGVDTKEINPSTMESKIIKNLYVCGEVLDVSGLTGGYNLQIAFSTGYLAGISAAK